MERKKFLVWKGGRSEEDDEKVAEFLKESDRDEEEVLEKLLEAKVNQRGRWSQGGNDAERGGGGYGRRCE